MKASAIAILLILLISTLSAQTLSPVPKMLQAKKVTQAPKIDGVLSEVEWANAEVATDFIDHEPFNGRKSAYKTVVSILFDNDAIYVGARLLDQGRDTLLMELGKRDEALDINADAFSMDICPSNDALNGFGFGISASGVLVDMKITGDDRDLSWDAVWAAAVSLDSTAWYVEMKIPFSAIRFPNVAEQVWGLNFWRQVRSSRDWSTWSFVNKDNESFLHQAGVLTGIRDVKPPVRLSINPYLSAYLISSKGEFTPKMNGGMDLKYGISQSHTLDLTLIPDFGQVESDELVLNLSPFEVQYEEKRSFFTEGNELFSRAGIFYTRRIGQAPRFGINGSGLQPGENMGPIPGQTSLINAFKVSGRDRNGLALGVMNALTRPAYTQAIDEEGNERELLIQPNTNYNVLVLDKSLKHNSYISFINTNVTRFGEAYSANVSGVDFNLNSSSLKYGSSGILSLSTVPTLDGRSNGFRYHVSAGKRTGRVRWTIKQYATTPGYNHNDLGYIDRSNFSITDAVLSYRQFQPKGRILGLSSTLLLEYQSLFEKFRYSAVVSTWNTNVTFKNRMSSGLYVECSPFERKDFYEPREEGWYMNSPSYASANSYISSDYSKVLALDVSAGLAASFDQSYFGHWLNFSPRYRPSNRMLFVPSLNYNMQMGDRGFVTKEWDANAEILHIFMGERDTKTITSSMFAVYRFSPNASLSLRFRHYWSSVEYYKFFELDSEGDITLTQRSFDSNVNFNAYTLDMGFLWDFAPGSQLSLVFKQASNDFQSTIIPRYIDNLDQSLRSDMLSSISLKVIYYIDYQGMKSVLSS